MVCLIIICTHSTEYTLSKKIIVYTKEMVYNVSIKTEQINHLTVYKQL